MSGKPETTHRTVLHIDIDAFFASVEQVLDPKLAGLPVIVGGREDDRSVVACASYEARPFGVKTGMPIKQARALCPQAVFLRGDHREYRKCSDAVMEILFEYSPLVEILSIDEACVDLTGTRRIHEKSRPRVPAKSLPIQARTGDFAWALNAAEQIKRDVKNATGLNVSIGAATNKLVARVACSRAKPNGIIQVWPGCEAAFVSSLPPGALPGVGRSTGEKLKNFNLHTVADLRRIPKSLLLATFGDVRGEMLYERCRGLDDSPVRLNGPPKSISRSTTFEKDTVDLNFIEGMLYYLTERAAGQLRSHKMKSRCVAAKLRYADFSTYVRSKRLQRPSNQDRDFFAVARDLLNSLYTGRMMVRLTGVVLSELSTTGFHQGDFFTWEKYLKRKRLYGALDGIRGRHGFSAVIAGPSIALMDSVRRDGRGYVLRTPSLSR
ncbi:MAG: DNA polymerase IV [Planctomycetota bacterium]